jgi:NhaP-type Na+/H+ or K+/H+ antiporter
MTPELAAQKKRLVVMASVNVAAAIVALGFVVAWAKYGIDWAFAAFVAALVVGFGAQIWFIAGFRRKGA